MLLLIFISNLVPFIQFDNLVTFIVHLALTMTRANVGITGHVESTGEEAGPDLM